ncbi:MAG: dolichol monophosphate mannose synthase [Rhizobiales bacterium 65-79]|nr:glycosyltransferase [Hyphomicrobiales bacterium]OJU04807.1 MAG: dolichol monophosphate mannose synthase [Rhizobiales bacterium 65-79]
MPIFTREGTDTPVQPGPELTVVVPTLNERANIPLLVERMAEAIIGINWEIVFVDDDSKDGTIQAVRSLANADHRVRGLRRIVRRGLAGACLEGMLSSSAPIVAVMDADLQHDEKCLPEMFRLLGAGDTDLVVATRYDAGGSASDGFGDFRARGSKLAVRLAKSLLKIELSDPMSGFFMLRREIVDEIAPRLSQQGFKILLDMVASSQRPLRIREIPYRFGQRLHGESKLDATVVLEYLGLLVAKASGDLVSTRFLAFGMVGSAGVIVHLATLRLLLVNGLTFTPAQTAAMFTAMAFNYTVNNSLTYRDRRRRGWRFFTGLGMFAALCSFGVVAGVGVSSVFYQSEPRWWLAGLAGAAVGAAWNYVTNSAVTWRSR